MADNDRKARRRLAEATFKAIQRQKHRPTTVTTPTDYRELKALLEGREATEE